MRRSDETKRWPGSNRRSTPLTTVYRKPSCQAGKPVRIVRLPPGYEFTDMRSIRRRTQVQRGFRLLIVLVVVLVLGFGLLLYGASVVSS